MTNVMNEENSKAKTQAMALATQALEADFSESYLARRMMRSAKKPAQAVYEFTNDPGLLHQYYRLREDMFISVWGLKNFSGEKEHFDDLSHIMVARQGLQCIAGGRLTISTPFNHQAMPMEKDDFKLKELMPDLNLAQRSYGEFSRLAILPEFRAGLVFPEIARRFIRRAIAEGVEYACNIAPQPLARSYRQAVQMFGLEWNVRHDVVVPDREEYEGIKMVLSVMDLRHFAKKPVIGAEQAEKLAPELLAD